MHGEVALFDDDEQTHEEVYLALADSEFSLPPDLQARTVNQASQVLEHISGTERRDCLLLLDGNLEKGSRTGQDARDILAIVRDYELERRLGIVVVWFSLTDMRKYNIRVEHDFNKLALHSAAGRIAFLELLRSINRAEA
jgi:hypothetical protein